VTAPLTHATVNALRYLRGEVYDDYFRAWWVACGGNAANRRAIGVAGIRDTIPTCPACAVLRDAALEGRTSEDK
jgi:hypothetical protein